LKTGVDPAELRRKLVLDAGCGHGLTIAQLGALGAHAVGCDLVTGPAQERLERESLYDFVQGDILSPPFREHIFDLVYAIGVIHHIPAGASALHSLARLTRRSGRLSIWVYADKSRRVSRFDDRLRGVTVRLPKRLVHAVSLVAAPIYPLVRRLQSAEERSIPWKCRPPMIFDWLKTPYRKFYRDGEVETCLARAGWSVAYRSPHRLGLSFVRSTAPTLTDPRSQ
jgi:SAM-dependent methyltransferase